MDVDERFIPGTSRITEMESFHRYLAAAVLCRGKKVLDAASGEGYGSDILAASAGEVTGLDICAEAVEQARGKYTASNLTFVRGDVCAMPFPDGAFDCAVSFETIEHLYEPERFLAELRRVLVPTGFVILSSPNKAAFDRRNHCENGGNIYHKHEMECDELTAMVKKYFPRFAVYPQDSFFGSQIGGDSAMRYFVKKDGGNIIAQDSLRRAQYSIVLCGAGKLPTLPPSSYIDAVFDDRFGYQPDDEAVVNQFGLRGEFERTCAQLAEERGRLEGLSGEAEQLRLRERTLSGELEAGRAALEQAGREVSSLRGELEKEKTAGQIMAAERARLEEKLETEHEAALGLQRELGAANARLEEEIKTQSVCRNELENARAEASSLQRELGLANGRLEEEIRTRGVLGKELENARAEASSLQRELGLANGRLEEEIRTRGVLGKELENVRAEASSLQRELGLANGRLEEVRSSCRTLREDNARLDEELGRLRADASELRKELGAAQNDLAASETEAASLREELAAVRASDSARIAELERKLGEECAKSEYLWREYEDLKKAWSLRLFGRFALRRKADRVLQGAGRFVCRCGKSALNGLAVRYETRMKLKDLIYSRFGFCLKSVRGYNDWLQRNGSLPPPGLTPGAGLDLPPDLPMTSIIIPVYNNLVYTLPCLHSIYAIKSRAPFEVIVVDDCSTEDYSVLKREYPQVKLIRNERNSGFLLTVNRGAREASGEYILILNNDTEVLPGWLDELATALYHHPEAGMIGSQLIHMRTGTLQESGDLICKNGEMLPLGRGAEPDHPEFSFFREVDFVSAASIILRKRVFEEMGGFDTSYAPAYYEDPDLGLRLQKAGYHNYVMPLSRVMHMEMASYGNALDSRCERNRRFFFDRWKNYLAEHALYDTPQDFVACRKFRRERLLYIDAEVPMADRGSGGMDAVFFMNYFVKRGFDVVFHGEYTPGIVPKYTEILLRMGVECVYLPHRRIWEYLASCGGTFSWLFISRIYQAQCFDRLLKEYCPQARYIFDTVDLHFIREQLEADLHGDSCLRKQAARTKAFELAVARNADATIVISSDEKKLLEEGYGLANVWHIPQARSVAGRKENVDRRGAVFIGSAHPPNMDGLRYFHDEILPLLPRDFRLTIIGEALRDVMSRLPEYRDLLKCPQFRFAGFVRDLGDELDKAQLTVAPLRYGAGTKGKVASSMSFGVPCVSSDFGVEGTGMVHGENILLARTPEAFAEAIRALCTDGALWKKISDGGLEFLKEKYDPGKVEAQMDALFDHVRRAGAAGWAASPVIPKQEELPPLE